MNMFFMKLVNKSMNVTKKKGAIVGLILYKSSY